MAKPLYARYVPPKPKPTAVFPEATPPFEDIPVVTSKTSKDRPKKRRREIVQDTPIASDSDEVTKRHRSVLSKYERSSRLAENARINSAEVPEENRVEDEGTSEVHDLIPLPQPESIPEAPFQPTFSALPQWLARPITIPSSTKISFEDLAIDPRLLKVLQGKGYRYALAVQSALLPMLRPGLQQHLGDICVSAATGSGKTLAYLLPMVEQLQGRAVTKLSGLIVVPTRELVSQVRTMAEQLCTGTRLKVGSAVGNVPFAEEQQLLVNCESKYDPDAAKRLHEKANEQLRTGFTERGDVLHDLMDMLPGHIPQYSSKVDILICTPGRLVEHLQGTTGFHFQDLRWLVIDEADRLLDQSFQEWVTVLMDALESETPLDQMTARERLFIERRWPKDKELTKIVLSATMTKDLSKLGSLKFRRPRLVVVENESRQPAADQQLPVDGETFDLPPTLKEYAVAVGDGTEKPLYLLYLLRKHLAGAFRDPKKVSKKDSVSEDDESDIESDISSSSDSETSLSSSSVESASDDLSTTSPRQNTRMKPSREKSSSNHPMSMTVAQRDTTTATDPASRVLIFTNNNENASRLSRLLSILHPPLKKIIGTLTKSSVTKTSRKTLNAFARGKIQILVASDRASRGLDVPDLGQIINYDLPRKVIDYVHRVGRTARAGKDGQAWTLFTKTEARWFWNDIARGHTVNRGARKVERVTLSSEGIGDEGRRTTYEAALKKLQLAVEGRTGRTVER